MYYLLIRNVWRDPEHHLLKIDVSEHQSSPGGTFLTLTPSRHFMFLSAAILPQINDRLLQLNQPLSLTGNDFMLVMYLHERSKRVFIVTTRVGEDSVEDGLADVTSEGFPEVIDTKP